MENESSSESVKGLDRAVKRAEVAGRVIRQIETLPAMPATAVQLRAAACDPRMDFTRIVPLIEKDPGLCADLLRFANSAAYGVGHPVETVSEAVLYFGMENLVEYILASYSNRLVRESFSRLKHLDDYFLHSEQVSVACCLLAKSANLPRHDQEVCKVTGLLHNIGKLVLLLASQQWGGPLMGTPWSDRQAMITAEEQLYGLSHCDVGALLCQKWLFPESLLNGIRHHHHPMPNGHLVPLAAYVYLGELLVIDDLPMRIITRDFTPTILGELKLSEDRLALARKTLVSAKKAGL